MYTLQPSNHKLNQDRWEKLWDTNGFWDIEIKTAGMHLTLKCFLTCMDNFQAVS